jgi:hypothetical protein
MSTRLPVFHRQDAKISVFIEGTLLPIKPLSKFISDASPTQHKILYCYETDKKDNLSNKQSHNNYVEDNLTNMALALNEFEGPNP